MRPGGLWDVLIRIMEEDPRVVLKRAHDRVSKNSGSSDDDSSSDFFQPNVHMSPEHDPYEVMSEAGRLNAMGVPIRRTLWVYKMRKHLKRKRHAEGS